MDFTSSVLNEQRVRNIRLKKNFRGRRAFTEVLTQEKQYRISKEKDGRIQVQKNKKTRKANKSTASLYVSDSSDAPNSPCSTSSGEEKTRL